MPNRHSPDSHPPQSTLSSSPTRYEASNRIPPPPPLSSPANLRQPSNRGGSGSSSGSSLPTGSGSSRGLSPVRDYRGDKARSGSGDSLNASGREMEAAGGPRSNSTGQHPASSSSRNARQEASDPGLAGRGAGNVSGGLMKGHLPPINTHLQPGGRMSPSLPSPTSATYDPSSSSHHSHRSSLLAHPRPLQPNAHSGPSSSSHRQTPSPTFPPPTNSSTSSTSHRSAGGSNSHSHQPPSRPGSAASQNRLPGSSEGHELVERERDRGRRRGDSGASGESASGGGGERSGGKRTGSPTTCAKCDLPMTGQFVRALGTVYHLDCFRCLVGSSLSPLIFENEIIDFILIRNRTVTRSSPPNSFLSSLPMVPDDRLHCAKPITSDD